VITLTDILIEKTRREEKYFKNYLKYSQLIKKEAERAAGKVKVYLFGSILRKREVPEDIDILIISSEFENKEKKRATRKRIIKKLGFFSPFQIHLVTEREYKNWYKYFIKKKKRI
jgi:hypothetical protein